MIFSFVHEYFIFTVLYDENTSNNLVKHLEIHDGLHDEELLYLDKLA